MIHRIHQGRAGNILVFILLGVALFGILTFTFIKTGQQRKSNLSEQQAKLAAQEIMAYGQSVAQGVQSLLNRGCSETQISFESAPADGYDNPNAPVDQSCDLFHSEGSGLSPASFTYGDILYTGKVSVFEKGCDATTDSCTELVFFVDNIPQNLCRAINLQAGIVHDETAIVDTYYTGAASTHKFTGSYTYSNFILGDDGTATNLRGEIAGCAKHAVTNAYAAFYVLSER